MYISIFNLINYFFIELGKFNSSIIKEKYATIHTRASIQIGVDELLGTALVRLCKSEDFQTKSSNKLR